MKKCISYSIFYREDQAFDFPSYLRGFMLNLRFARLIYPGWKVILYCDQATVDKAGKLLEAIPGLEYHVCQNAPLTKAMLWRMKPIYDRVWSEEAQGFGDWKYSHVLCRDVDSPLTYKERQAVEYWIAKDTTVHAITDSVSHTLPMMGGMVGFRPGYFTERMNCKTWDELMSLGSHIDYNHKGADQAFLNSHVYPAFSRHGKDSITQHYFQGMPNTYLSDFRTCGCSPLASHVLRCPNDYEIDLPVELKDSQSCCGHIGAAGWYQTSTERFLRKYADRFEDLKQAESNYPDTFYWVKDGSLG